MAQEITLASGETVTVTELKTRIGRVWEIARNSMKLQDYYREQATQPGVWEHTALGYYEDARREEEKANRHLKIHDNLITVLIAA